MIAAPPKPIQGLFTPDDLGQSYWSLKAKIDLSVFSENHVETGKKEQQIPPLADQKGEGLQENWWRFHPLQGKSQIITGNV